MLVMAQVLRGTGAVATGAAARVGATGSATGVDNNPGMLAVASARSRHEVRWQEADAQTLPFPTVVSTG
jgi:ubiquinone/menaquinone biosynthesis C-methylase UbiE